MIAPAVAGVVLTAAGLLLDTVPLHHATIPQWNGLCASGIGQVGQFFDSSAQHDCAVASLADHLIGWLVGTGLVMLALCGVIWLARRPRPR